MFAARLRMERTCTSSAIHSFDRYLEFVAGRVRANALRAVAFDLKTFFTVVDKSPTDVVAGDIFDFLAHERGDRRVVRLIDGESGLAARTTPAGCRRCPVSTPTRSPGTTRRSVQPGAPRAVDPTEGQAGHPRRAGSCAPHVAQDPLA